METGNTVLILIFWPHVSEYSSTLYLLLFLLPIRPKWAQFQTLVMWSSEYFDFFAWSYQLQREYYYVFTFSMSTLRIELYFLDDYIQWKYICVQHN